MTTLDLEPPEQAARPAQPTPAAETTLPPAMADLRSRRRLRLGPADIALANRLLDLAIIVAAGILAAKLNDGALAKYLPLTERNLAICLAGALFVMLSGNTPQHDADAILRLTLARRLSGALAACLLPIAAAGAVLFGSAADRAMSMLWLSVWIVLAAALLVPLTVGLHLAVRFWVDRGCLAMRIAIVGASEQTQRLLDFLTGQEDTIRVVGVFDDRRRDEPAIAAMQHLMAGTTSDLVELSRQVDIDHIVLALPNNAEQRLLDLLHKLRQIPVDITLSPEVVGLRLPEKRSKPAEIAGLPMLTLGRRPMLRSHRIAKEILDRVAAFTALALLSPLLLGVALAIKATSPGPVLFRQERYGLGNRIIPVFKFRTMRVDMADPGGSRQTQRDDPRVTGLGHFLRCTSIDELPQLLNVLRGEMSLVGPRPMPLKMRVENRLNHEIISEYAFRHRVKPGITGWAQVNGSRGALETAEELRQRFEHDLYYIDHCSLLLDLRIMLRTFKVITHQNAF